MFNLIMLNFVYHLIGFSKFLNGTYATKYRAQGLLVNVKLRHFYLPVQIYE